MFTLLGCVSSLYAWFTANTWSVGTRGTLLKIETPAILCNRQECPGSLYGVDNCSASLRYFPTLFRSVIGVPMTSRYAQELFLLLKLVADQGNAERLWKLLYFQILGLILLKSRMGLFGQTPQKTPKEQVCLNCIKGTVFLTYCLRDCIPVQSFGFISFLIRLCRRCVVETKDKAFLCAYITHLPCNSIIYTVYYNWTESTLINKLSSYLKSSLNSEPVK